VQPQFLDSRWVALQAKAHLPEAQAIIRREIFRGTIRVVPAPGGGIRIIPTTDGSPIEHQPEASRPAMLVPEEIL
jgi:hypothetical protein